MILNDSDSEHTFQPPNEKAAKGAGTPRLTPSMPAWMRALKARTAAPSAVKIDALFPNGDAFAAAMASSRLAARTTATSGPKTSVVTAAPGAGSVPMPSEVHWQPDSEAAPSAQRGLASESSESY